MLDSTINIDPSTEVVVIQTAQASFSIILSDCKPLLPTTKGFIRQVDSTRDGVDTFKVGETHVAINYAQQQIHIWNYKHLGHSEDEQGTMTIVIANHRRGNLNPVPDVEDDFVAHARTLPGRVHDFVPSVKDRYADAVGPDLRLIRGMGLNATPVQLQN